MGRIQNGGFCPDSSGQAEFIGNDIKLVEHPLFLDKKEAPVVRPGLQI
jgi:hypothetical protein